MTEATKLLRSYESGRLTHHELLIRLLQAAAKQSPVEIAANLDSELLAALRERTADLPSSPDECRVMSAYSAGPGFDAEAHFLEESRRLYDGIRRWHQYLFNA